MTASCMPALVLPRAMVKSGSIAGLRGRRLGVIIWDGMAPIMNVCTAWLLSVENFTPVWDCRQAKPKFGNITAHRGRKEAEMGQGGRMPLTRLSLLLKLIITNFPRG